MTGNKIHTWRHGLHASEAKVTATRNSVSDFHKAAFVIQKPADPAVVFGNEVTAKDPADKAALLDGEEGVATDNKTTLSPPQSALPPPP